MLNVYLKDNINIKYMKDFKLFIDIICFFSIFFWSIGLYKPTIYF